MIARRSRGTGTAIATAVLAVTMVGCASIPTNGPVVRGAGGEDPGEGAGGYVRMLPAGPQPDVGEEDLVKGFLRDMGSFEENHHAARLYLMPRPQETWAPEGEVLVYDDMDSVTFDTDISADGTSAEIRMHGPHIASISGDGQYLPQEPDKTIDVTFTLSKDEGEWRIADLPDSLILGRRDIERAYRPINLYFFNDDRSTLVPDPVFLPVSSENLATHLVRTLVAGPTGWLEPAVRSAFPEGTTADVAYDSGVVTIELNGAASPEDDDYGMAAQLAWTLKQLPEVQEFVLRIDGEEIDLPGGDPENLQGATEDQWSDVDPGGLPGSPKAYFVRDGQLWSLAGDGHEDEHREARLEGAPGDGGTPLHQHAVSLDESQVAGIEADHHSVVLAEPEGGGEFSTVLSGGEYTALSWGPRDNLWVVEETPGDEDDGSDGGSDGDGAGSSDASDGEEAAAGSTLWTLLDGSEPVEVNAPQLENVAVSALRVSRDGTRAAVIAERDDGPRLYVGRITGSGDDMTLDEFIPLGQDLDEISDITWRGGDQLAVLGKKERGASQAFLVSLDGGTEITGAGAPTGADMESLTAAPGRPLLSGADDDQVWMTNDRVMWRYVVDGTSPTYPG